MSRYEQLQAILFKVDTEKREVIEPLISEIVFMENRLRDLRQMPMIRVHPHDKTRQETTAAGKQYKETMQAYLNALKVVMTALYRVEGGAADELLEKLKEFEA